jgi:hypothetical protein
MALEDAPRLKAVRMPNPGEIYSIPQGDDARDWVDAALEAMKRLHGNENVEWSDEFLELLTYMMREYGKQIWRGTRRQAAAALSNTEFNIQADDRTPVEIAVAVRDILADKLRD